MRLFIAIAIPLENQKRLDKKLNSEKKYIEKHTLGKLKWVAPKNWHITLKFLGDIRTGNYQTLLKLLNGFFTDHEHFSVMLSHFTLWPYSKPRVVLCQIAENEILNSLNYNLAQLIDDSGLIRQELKGTKSPHLTLARLKGQWQGGKYFSPYNDIFKVKQISLFQSELHPQGPTYTELETFYLK